MNLSSKLVLNLFSEPRDEITNEIRPIDVQHSATQNDNETSNAAQHATDMDLGTQSITVADSNGKSWLKITLGKVYCVKEVISFHETGSPKIKWTCSTADCNTCTISRFCSSYTLTVTGAGAAKDTPDCKNGNTVELERNDKKAIYVSEIAIAAGNRGQEICDIRSIV